jgi:hypothetical protein
MVIPAKAVRLRRTDAVPAKTGDGSNELVSCFQGKSWIPGQTRNDRPYLKISFGLLLFAFLFIFFSAFSVLSVVKK